MSPTVAQITPLLLTYNEEPNLPRTLAALEWAPEIVVVDSLSTDRTCDFVRARPGAQLYQRPFDTFANQCNFGLQHVNTSWVLSLDADYVLTPELTDEMASLDLNGPAVGYSARFRYCVHGRPLRASLYPPRVVLYRKDRARYRDEGHGHRVQVDGEIRPLHGMILHDDRKPLDRWFSEQNKYATREARYLIEAPAASLNRHDHVRRQIWLAPLLVFLYTLFVKGLILDGWPGGLYVMQRTLAELMISLQLLEWKLAVKSPSSPVSRR